MKYLPVVALFAIAGVAALSQLFIGNDAVVMNERVQVDTPEVVEQMEVDIVESAKLELERINLELDGEEVRLLEERDAIDTRLEQIRETRTSFQ